MRKKRNEGRGALAPGSLTTQIASLLAPETKKQQQKTLAPLSLSPHHQ